MKEMEERILDIQDKIEEIDVSTKGNTTVEMFVTFLSQRQHLLICFKQGVQEEIIFSITR